MLNKTASVALAGGVLAAAALTAAASASAAAPSHRASSHTVTDGHVRVVTSEGWEVFHQAGSTKAHYDVYARVGVYTTDHRAHTETGTLYIQVNGGAWKAAKKFKIAGSPKATATAKQPKTGLVPSSVRVGDRVRAITVLPGVGTFASATLTVGR